MPFAHVTVVSGRKTRRYPVMHAGYETAGGVQPPTDEDFIAIAREDFRRDGSSEDEVAAATFRVERE